MAESRRQKGFIPMLMARVIWRLNCNSENQALKLNPNDKVALEYLKVAEDGLRRSQLAIAHRVGRVAMHLLSLLS